MEQFVIGVGSQRAGSTLLYKLLDECSEIFMHPIKELHYFDTLCGVRGARLIRLACMHRLNREWDRLLDSDEFSYVDDRYKCYISTNRRLWTEDVKSIRYLDLFLPAARGRAYLGEVTPEYMVLPESGIQRMRAEIGAKAKIIIIARNPVRRLVSAFKLLRMHGNSDYDMGEFARDLSRSIERMPNFLAQQDQLNAYQAALLAFRRHFSNVLLLSYDALIDPTCPARQQLQDFLGIELSRRRMKTILGTKVNELGKTPRIDQQTERLLTRRYTDVTSFLSSQFGPNGCVR